MRTTLPAALAAAGALALSAATAGANPADPAPYHAAHLRQHLAQAQLAQRYAGHPAAVAFDSTFTHVQESGLATTTRKILYQPLTPAGAADLAALVVDYMPASAQVEITRVAVLEAGGGEREIGPAHDYPAPTRKIYWGGRQKMAHVGALAPGDAVYLEYRRKGFSYALLRDGGNATATATAGGASADIATPPNPGGDSGDDSRFVPPMRGHYYDIVEFGGPLPVDRKYLAVTLPADKKLVTRTYNAAFQTTESVAGGWRTATFGLAGTEPLPREPHRLADTDLGPKVIVTTTERWEEKAIWFHDVNEDFGSFASTPAIDAKVREILQGARDEADSISRVNRWAANEIRYSGIPMPAGEGYTLHPGAMTFADRCGVCKDKAGMAVTMLRAAGFEAYAAMTMAGSRIEDVPADQFNHSVAVVKTRAGEWKLLDPTWVPFVAEDWSSREQQQDYLAGLPGGDILRQTPISPAQDHRLRVRNQGKIDAQGNLQATLTVEATGQSDATLRQIFTRAERRDWEQNLRRQITGLYPEAEIEQATHTDPYLYHQQATRIEIRYRVPRFAAAAGRSMAVETVTARGAFLYAQFYGRWDEPAQGRKHGFAARCSQEVTLEEELTFPAAITIPADAALDARHQGKHASIEARVEAKGNTLSTFRRERYKQRVYPAEASAEFAKLAQLRDAHRRPILVELEKGK